MAESTSDGPAKRVMAGGGLEVRVLLDEPRHAIAVTPRGVAQLAATWVLRGRVVEGSVAAAGREVRLRLRPFAHSSLELSLAITVDAGDDAPGMTIDLDAPPDLAFEMLDCGPISPRTPGGWSGLTPYVEGRVDDLRPGFSDHRRLGFEGMSLPLVALLRGPRAEAGSLLFFTPQGQDHGTRVEVGEDGVPQVTLVQEAALGRWSYARRWRVIPVPGAGLVELARIVRRELRSAGFALRPLPEKLAEHGLPPELLPSVGGTHLWWHVDPMPQRLPAALRDAGVRSVLLQGYGPAAASARACGYVFGSYYQSSDVLPPGFGEPLEWRHIYPNEDVTRGWPEQLLRDRAGWPERNWFHLPASDDGPYWGAEDYLDENGSPARRTVALKSFRSTQGYSRCPVFYVERARASALPMLERDGCSGVFYDVLTAAGAKECYAPEHPCDRPGDQRRRQAAFAAVATTGRYVGSEFGRWWALDVVHGFEGMLTDGEWDANHSVIGDYPFRSEWYDSQFDLQRRVPFFGMVARECVARTLWWGQGNDRHAESWGAKDALCAVYGGNPIFVADPSHPIAPGADRWERFLQTARAFDELWRRTAGARIVKHEVLGKHVAVTEFEGGAAVHANTGPSPADGLAAGSFEIL